MSKISKDDVLKLAELAKLNISPKEVAKYQSELNSIVQYIDILETLDLSGYKPTAQVTGIVNATREDETQPQLASPDELVKNAPQTQDGQIKVSRMIG